MKFNILNISYIKENLSFVYFYETGIILNSDYLRILANMQMTSSIHCLNFLSITQTAVILTSTSAVYCKYIAETYSFLQITHQKTQLPAAASWWPKCEELIIYDQLIWIEQSAAYCMTCCFSQTLSLFNLLLHLRY